MLTRMLFSGSDGQGRNWIGIFCKWRQRLCLWWSLSWSSACTEQLLAFSRVASIFLGSVWSVLWSVTMPHGSNSYWMQCSKLLCSIHGLGEEKGYLNPKRSGLTGSVQNKFWRAGMNTGKKMSPGLVEGCAVCARIKGRKIRCTPRMTGQSCGDSSMLGLCKYPCREMM